MDALKIRLPHYLDSFDVFRDVSLPVCHIYPNEAMVSAVLPARRGE